MFVNKTIIQHTNLPYEKFSYLDGPDMTTQTVYLIRNPLRAEEALQIVDHTGLIAVNARIPQSLQWRSGVSEKGRLAMFVDDELIEHGAHFIKVNENLQSPNPDFTNDVTWAYINVGDALRSILTDTSRQMDTRAVLLSMLG